MTKKQKRELESILHNLKAARKFLTRKDIKVCTTMLPHLQSYYHKDGEGITPISIGCGSEIVYLWTAIEKLDKFLNPEPIKTQSYGLQTTVGAI